MKQKLPIFLIILFLTFSCVQKKENRKKTNELDVGIKEKIITKKEQFQNSFKIDTSLTKKIAFDFIKVSNSLKTDSILSICNCDKDKKTNTIKIQLETGIPIKKDLDTISESSNKKWNTVLQTRDLGYLKELKGQFKFLNIILKDCLVKSINLYSKSTAKEYNGNDFDSLSIERYKINISKFNYSIASDIYGEFEFRLNKEFGLFKNDTILKGRFLCNNWRIWESEKIKNWNINKQSKETSIE
ncbi:hypothetical protein [Thalassobellus suaedae]|uniref:Lipoprotein n=1 Tax=Thalassobellus suaedae TaxID=3074124 RepID=A0ABY9Y3H8_9FLAO|nr:hypothetical protein RHP49_00655 [Flavobacteriaceae bacterium HL-DH10]